MVIDDYGQVTNCYDSALHIRNILASKRLQSTVAIPLSLGNMTMFHMSFVNLSKVLGLFDVIYSDGSNRGLQINIERHSSYALPWGSSIGEHTYIMNKWNLMEGDAIALLPFFNTILTGEDYFKIYENKN